MIFIEHEALNLTRFTHKPKPPNKQRKMKPQFDPDLPCGRSASISQVTLLLPQSIVHPTTSVGASLTCPTLPHLLRRDLPTVTPAIFFGKHFFATPAFLDIKSFFAELFAVSLVEGVFLLGELDLAVELELFATLFWAVPFFVMVLGFLTPAPVLAVFFAAVFLTAAFSGLFTAVTALWMSLSGAPGNVPSRWRVTLPKVNFFGGDAFGGWALGFG